MPKQANGARQMTIALDPDMPFDQMVKYLREAFTLPKPALRGPRLCAPCLSGLDRLILESRVLERTR